MMTFLERVFHLCSGLYCFLSFFFQTTLSRSKCSITSHSVERIVDFEIQHSSTPGNISHPCDNTNDERSEGVDSVTTSAQCNLEKTEKRSITCGRFLRRSQTIGSLRSYDGNCNENATLKLKFALSKVFCDYSILITLYKIGGVHFRLLGMNGFHVKAKNERFTAASSRCRQNLKYENFTSSFGRLRQNIAAKSVPDVQHDYFSSFNQSNH